MNRLSGQCHCGNIAFTFETELSADTLPLRRCSCDFCNRIDGLYTSDPLGHLAVTLSNGSNIYRFGHQTADFHICPDCGCMPIITCDISNEIKAVVNARMITSVDIDLERAAPFDTNHESTEERLTRRSSTWIGTVQLHGPRQCSKP